MSYEKKLLVVFVAYLIIMSLKTLFLFMKDKSMAKKNQSAVRIKEKTLLGSVVFGGAIGGFFGRLIAHHKTNKLYFSFTIYLSILLQLVTCGVLIYMAI